VRLRDAKGRLWTLYCVIAWLCVPVVLVVALHRWPTTDTSPAPRDTTTTSSGPRVLIFGDSISQVASPDVNAALGTRYKLTTNARYRSTRGTEARPDAAIIELGSDAALLGTQSWQPDLDAILATVRPVACVAFVTVSPVEDYYFTTLTHQRPRNIAAKWNAALRAAVGRDPHFHLVDWAAVATPEAGFVYDGTHPTELGRAWLVAQYRKVLDQQCRLAFTR
jgi:hypothetical protein